MAGYERKITGSRMPPKTSSRKKPSLTDLRDLDDKIEFMEGLVRRAPDYVEVLQLLGDHYTARGRYADWPPYRAYQLGFARGARS